MSRAWLFQDSRQKKKLGAVNCPWSVGYYDPEGKRKSKVVGSRSRAEKERRKIEGQLTAGVYEDVTRASWGQFIAAYESRALVKLRPSTRETTQYALNHFDRIIRPKRVSAITTKTIDEYVAVRRTESIGPQRTDKATVREVQALLKAGELTEEEICRATGVGIRTLRRIKRGDQGKRTTPATINRELRTLRAVLRKAVNWGYLARCPDFQFLKEPGKVPSYVTPDDFVAIYQACDSARWPDLGPFPPADWWRGLVTMAYMTGWRISALLALRWEDVDLDAATAFSRAEDNKGNRDQLVPLHPLVVAHLRPLASFHALVFPWNHDRGAVLKEFHRLQRAAGVKPPFARRSRYGFHDLRRAFATENADTLSPDQLQLMMQHRAYSTTQRYINLARQASSVTDKLFVPKISRESAG